MRAGEGQVLHRYTMAEDPALAVAFANSLRSAAVATLKVDGRFVSTKRMYLDSQARRPPARTPFARQPEPAGPQPKPVCNPAGSPPPGW